MCRWLVMAAVLCVGLGACSAKTVASTSPSSSPGAPTHRAPTTPGGPPSSSATSPHPSSPSSTPANTGESTSPGPAANNDFKLDVRLSRTCVRRGDKIEATIETIPGVSLGMATQYPDNQQIPDYEYVPREANTNGHHTWAWVIRPTLPDGNSSLIVVASASGKGGARYVAPFRIASSC